MERWTTRPIAFVTTVQPFLLAWIVAISFFLSVAIVALISREKTWQQILGYFLLTFVLTTVATLVGVEFALEIQVIDLEIIWVPFQQG